MCHTVCDSTTGSPTKEEMDRSTVKKKKKGHKIEIKAFFSKNVLAGQQQEMFNTISPKHRTLFRSFKKS